MACPYTHVVFDTTHDGREVTILFGFKEGKGDEVGCYVAQPGFKARLRRWSAEEFLRQMSTVPSAVAVYNAALAQA